MIDNGNNACSEMLKCCFLLLILCQILIFVVACFSQSGQLDLRHFDPEFVREPVPGKFLIQNTTHVPQIEQPWVFIYMYKPHK